MRNIKINVLRNERLECFTAAHAFETNSKFLKPVLIDTYHKTNFCSLNIRLTKTKKYKQEQRFKVVAAIMCSYLNGNRTEQPTRKQRIEKL